jgi:hypothetical protein
MHVYRIPNCLRSIRSQSSGSEGWTSLTERVNPQKACIYAGQITLSTASVEESIVLKKAQGVT